MSLSYDSCMDIVEEIGHSDNDIEGSYSDESSEDCETPQADEFLYCVSLHVLEAIPTNRFFCKLHYFLNNFLEL